MGRFEAELKKKSHSEASIWRIRNKIDLAKAGAEKNETGSDPSAKNERLSQTNNLLKDMVNKRLSNNFFKTPSFLFDGVFCFNTFGTVIVNPII